MYETLQQVHNLLTVRDNEMLYKYMVLSKIVR
jgi:hypothetical protein